MLNELRQYTRAGLCLINNPVDCGLTRSMADLKPDGTISIVGNNRKNLVFIGRLTYQKGIDILVDFAKYLNDDVLIHVFGSGDLEGWLEQEIEALGLEGRIVVYGTYNNPFYILSKSDFLVMSSRYEGFPNVALESLSLGVPIVTVPFKGGQKEIFEDGKNCVLSNEATGESLFIAYKKALTMSFNSNQIAEDTYNKFDISIVADKYKRVLS